MSAPFRTTAYLVVSTYAPAVRTDGRIFVERKTRDGLARLQRDLAMAVVLVAPEGPAGATNLIDPVAIDDGDADCAAVLCERGTRPGAELLEVLRRASVVYGMGVDVLTTAVALGVPIVPIVENTLGNNLRILWNQHGPGLTLARRCWGALREHLRLRNCHRRAAVIHAIGAIAYESLVDRHPAELFLDSRISGDRIVSAEHVERRVASLASGRRFRLVSFGRLEPLKGPDRVVWAAIEMIRAGFDVELDLYGDGSCAAALQRTIRATAMQDRLRMHGAVPFPVLVEAAGACDMFLAGNVQDDPSCAYLEAFGMGLPVVGIGNRSWQRLAGASGAGVVVPSRSPVAIGRHAAELLASPQTLLRLSLAARSFALRHCFEEEFGRRAASLVTVIEGRHLRARGGR